MRDESARVLSRRELWSVLITLFTFVSVTVFSIALAIWFTAGGGP
ncbi:MAG: hypothetical protein ACTHNU_11135 [Gaiellales bacterium]